MADCKRHGVEHMENGICGLCEMLKHTFSKTMPIAMSESKVVPVSPTDVMIVAGQTCINPYNLYSIWKAMLDAAPSADQGELVAEAKQRIRTAMKMYHNADENWSNEIVPGTNLSYLEWIDEGIAAAALQSAAGRKDAFPIQLLEDCMAYIMTVRKDTAKYASIELMGRIRVAIDAAIAGNIK